MAEKATLDEIISMVLETKAAEIRDVPLKVTNKEVENLPLENRPFLYASGNWGPGYVSIKGLVGRKKIIRFLTEQLAIRIVETVPRLDFVLSSIDIDFVAGNVTGGMIPGWILSEALEEILGKTVPFVYVRELRKKGGQKEQITGIINNPEISPGMNGLVVEELVNFAQTTCNGAIVLREGGYRATHAATILFYDNPEAVKALEDLDITMVYLFTLPDLLAAAEKQQAYPQRAIADYREFLTDPLGWQAARGLTPIERGGTI